MDINEQLKDVISALAKSFDDEDEQQFSDAAAAILKQYPADSVNPETYACLVQFGILEKLDGVLIRKYFPDTETNRAIKHAVKFYNFMDHHIQNLVIDVRGTMACSADRSRWILKSYINYLRTGELPDMTDDWYKPGFGTADQWMRYCDSLARLAYGHPDSYISCLQELKNNTIEN